MKDNLKNALVVVAALLFYVGAYFATMKVRPIDLNVRRFTGRHVILAEAATRPRWGDPFIKEKAWGTRVILFVFTPLSWAERKLRGEDYFDWQEGGTQPDWAK